MVTTQRGTPARVALFVAALMAPLTGMAEDAPIDDRAALEARGARALEDAPDLAAGRTVFRGGTVLTAAGDRIERGTVVVKGQRIAAVGTEASADAADRVVDLTGKFVTPGIIDTHSHLGVYPSPGGKAHSDGNETSRNATPGVWAEHSVWPQDPGFQRAVAGGVTTLQILPGSANLIGGRGVVVRPLPTRGSRAMRFPGAPSTLKMACGENPKRYHKGTTTRMGNVKGQRDAFIAAREYRKQWAQYETKRAEWTPGDDEPKPPKQDLGHDTLVGVMNGDILPQIHCYRADDMLAMMQIGDEFGFKIRSFHHAIEAYKIRDILAARDVSVSTWADWWGFKLEAYDGIQANAALVADAGGRAIIHSDSAIGIQRLNQEAAKAMAAGREAGIAVSENEALRWITANPAWALGIDQDTGTLEPGKRADLVVWDGHPFSVYSRPEQVWIDGALVFDTRADVAWSDFEVGQEVAR